MHRLSDTFTTMHIASEISMVLGVSITDRVMPPVLNVCRPMQVIQMLLVLGTVSLRSLEQLPVAIVMCAGVWALVDVKEIILRLIPSTMLACIEVSPDRPRVLIVCTMVTIVV